MGIDIETARFLFSARRSGVSFSRCATLGRQHYFPSNKETQQLLQEFGFAPGGCEDLLAQAPPRYSEPVWRVLGTEHLTTIDASSFEQATLVHDLNQPVPAELHGQFDAVCDIGTLEHVFNFPTAIRSCLEMVKVGGHFISHTTANNCFGHGFYQFSPELFFRILSPANGYMVERIVAAEYGPRRRWYAVTDPETIRQRVTLVNHFPVLMLIQARRTAQVPILTQTPQQSDYVMMWKDGAPEAPFTAEPVAAGSWIQRAKRSFLETAPALARALEAYGLSALNRKYSFRNRLYFQPLKK